jgi:hypothetical protein
LKESIVRGRSNALVKVERIAPGEETEGVCETQEEKGIGMEEE